MTTVPFVPDTVLRDTVSVFPAKLAAPRLTVLRVGYAVAGELRRVKVSDARGTPGVHTRVLFCGLSAESFTISHRFQTPDPTATNHEGVRGLDQEKA
jgi:hypothetical protein